MLAFVRVMLFYLGFAAFLIWGIFALGLADALEMPGFEGARAPVATTPMPVAIRPVPEVTKPAGVSEPETVVAKSSQPRDIGPAMSRRESMPEPAPVAKRVIVDVPAAVPAVIAPAVPPARTEVAAASPVAEPKRTVEPPRVAAPVLPPPARIETKAREPVLEPVVKPVVRAAPSAPSVRPEVVDNAPVKPPRVEAPKLPPQTRARAASEPKSWAPVHRLAGFGAAGLAEHLADKRRARDDIACVMFRNIVFKGGTTIYRPSARADLEQVAKALNAHPGQRVELGSRLGPGRPMATDAKLRSDRAELVRNSLIALGVAPARLSIDNREAYERVAADVGRVKGVRIQSMGVCIRAT